MPTPDNVGPDTPQADARLIEFIERRRAEQARDRRQRLQLVVIACLGVIGLLLTVSNAVIVSRLLAGPSVPPATAPLPPVRAAAPATATVLPPEPVAESAATPPAPSEPVERTPPPQQTALARSPTPTRTPPSETDSARRTARWLVQTYGPVEAEVRALAAAQFYSGEDRRFWRRVAVYTQQHPAR